MNPTTPLHSVDAATIAGHPAWAAIKNAALAIRSHQAHDGSVPDQSAHSALQADVRSLSDGLRQLAPLLPHDAEYLGACAADFDAWAQGGFVVPDFYDSLDRFHPDRSRGAGVVHVVVFPMYTQNGSTDRLVEAVICEVIWPDFVADLESTAYSNPLFVPIRFIDYTPGYETNSAVLFPESVAVTPRVPAGSPAGTAPALPAFTWGGIFADREAARFRHVVREASDITHLELPTEALELLADQTLTEHTFVMWDLIHDRTHMRGDLPFDPFMIKQRMPFFLYGLEELRCDLTAFRECVRISEDPQYDESTRRHARLVQFAVLFDRIFRFPLTGSRVRNYDGMAGQLLFAWLHQKGVLHWTDTSLDIEWDRMPEAVIALSDDINHLYWASIDRPKTVHWLAAWDLVARTLAPHPGSRFASRDLPLLGSPKELTDCVLDDEFPLSMFYEALQKKMSGAIERAVGLTGMSVVG